MRSAGDDVDDRKRRNRQQPDERDRDQPAAGEPTRKIVDALAATMPNIRLLELPGDHASHLQNVERFITELTAHVASEATRPVRT